MLHFRFLVLILYAYSSLILDGGKGYSYSSTVDGRNHNATLRRQRGLLGSNTNPAFPSSRSFPRLIPHLTSVSKLALQPRSVDGDL